MFKVGTERLTWMTVEWTGVDTEGFEVANKMDQQVVLIDMTPLTEHITAERAGDARTIDLAEQVNRDWRGVGDAGGNVMPFTKENFRLLYEVPGFAQAWSTTYLQTWNGQGKVREKNSQTSPGAGPGGDQAPATA